MWDASSAQPGYPLASHWAGVLFSHESVLQVPVSEIAQQLQELGIERVRRIKSTDADAGRIILAPHINILPIGSLWHCPYQL